MKTFECYFDGSCSGNPGGEMGVGVYITCNGKGYRFSKRYELSPNNTNNVAEYMGVIEIFNSFTGKTGYTIHIYGDSELVIKQMNGEKKIKKGMYVQKARQAKVLYEELKKKNTITFKWIPRELNTIADELSNPKK